MSIIIHSLERNTLLTYIYRLYSEKGTLRYIFAMPVSYRGNGEWEAHAWNSLYKLWPEGEERPQFQELMVWIRHELKKNHTHGWLYKKISLVLEKVFKITLMPHFEKLTGTFEVDRLSAYKRAFRRWFNLIPIRVIRKKYNDADLVAMYIEFKPIKGKEDKI